MKTYPMLGLVLILGACAGEPAPPPEMTNAERGQIQAEVLGWADQWLEEAANLDAQGVGTLMDQADGHFMRVTSYEANWQAFLTGSQETYGGWASWEPAWTGKRVDVLSADAALFVGEAEGPLRYSDGREVDQHSVFSFVLRKKDGIWKGLFGQVAAETAPQGD